MSQALILKKAEAAIRANLIDLVREIFSSAEEKPNSETTGKILVLAAKEDLWDLVYEICSMEGANKADEPAIAKVLEEAYRRQKVSDFKWICQNSRTAPTRATIESLLKKTISASDDFRWEYMAYLCFLETENMPSQEVIDKALKEAAGLRNWNLASKLVKIKDTNTPSEPALAYTLQRAYEQNQFDHFVFICEQSTTPPSQGTIEFILNKAISASDSTRLAYIEYLCFTYKKIQPGKTFIDRALKDAAQTLNWELALMLVKMTGNNSPSEPAIAYALKQAYPQNFGVFTSICKESTTPPSQATINSSLEAAIRGNQKNRWEYINYLCFLETDNKPEQSSINKALREAAKCNQWKLAFMLIKLTGDNQPNQKAIEFLLEAAAKSNELSLIQDICDMPLDRRPRQSSIEKGLINAAAAGHLETVIYFSELKSDNKPLQSSYEKAFLQAASHDRDEICHYFNELDVLAIDLTLNTAAKEGNLKAIEFILNCCNQLKKEDIEKAFIQAVSVGQTETVQYFMKPKNRNELSPEVIDKAIEAAASAPFGEIIINYLKLNQENTKVVLPKSTVMPIPAETNLPKTALKTTPAKTNLPPIDQLSAIRQAVARAQGLYQEWYADKDGKKNIRCDNGFFSHWCFRHGPSGQKRAQDILGRVNIEKTAQGAASFVNEFLTDDKTAYERHSFSSFLIDELKKIKGSSWSGITLSASLHYDQDDVNQQLTPRQSNMPRR